MTLNHSAVRSSAELLFYFVIGMRGIHKLMVNETTESQSIGLDLRYTRSFLVDLRDLEISDQERIFALIFKKYRRLEHIYDLPGLVKLNAEGTLYRCTLDKYTIGLELKGNIIKFWRVLPTPVI